MPDLRVVLRDWTSAVFRFVMAASFLNRLLNDFTGLPYWSYEKLFLGGAVVAATWLPIVEYQRRRKKKAASNSSCEKTS